MIGRALLAVALELGLAWLRMHGGAESGILLADTGAGAGSTIINLASSLFKFLGGGKDSGLGGSLLKIANFLGDLAKTVARFMRDNDLGFSKLWGLIRKFWDRVLFPLIQQLDRYLARLFKWLRDEFGPIIDGLLWLRKKILEWYDKWLRPIFDTIDVIRRVLGIFSFFGLEWARRIDRALAAIQAKFDEAIGKVLARLNETIDFVNRIVTIDGLLQRYTLVRSLILHQRDALKVWWSSIHKPLSGQSKQQYEQKPAPVNVAARAGDMRAYVYRHAGQDVARIDEYAAAYRLEIEAP